jgi:hypothetical protein
MSAGRRGTSPEYPDFRHGSTAGPAGPPPELNEHDIDRIAAERSQQDEELKKYPRPSRWSRLFRRHR